MPSKIRKYIQVEDRNPFSEDFTPEDLVRATEGLSASASFVPGYSDVRIQNELRKAEGKYDELEPLKHRFHWIRAKSATDDKVDGRSLYRWKVSKHYDTPDYDDVVKAGYDLTQNPAIVKGPDGKAYYGENILGWVDGITAGAQWQQAQQANQDQLDAPAQAMEEAIDRFNASTVAGKTGMKASHFEFVEEVDKQGKPHKQ